MWFGSIELPLCNHYNQYHSSSACSYEDITKINQSVDKNKEAMLPGNKIYNKEIEGKEEKKGDKVVKETPVAEEAIETKEEKENFKDFEEFQGLGDLKEDDDDDEVGPDQVGYVDDMKGELIYTGALAAAIKLLKRVSLTTFTLGMIMTPLALYLKPETMPLA